MNFKTLTAIFLMSTAMTSCIQDEALNSEAAIDACSGQDIQQATIDAENFRIQLYVTKAINLSKININFTLPDGATISPVTPQAGDQGAFYDFSQERKRDFKVTSEDGEFTAKYAITVWQTELPSTYRFELLSSEAPYHVLYEEDNTTSGNEYISRRLEWASGNPGFKLTGEGKTPTDYPTIQISGGFSGKGVKLETKDTGPFGEMVKMYIAAGNLFIGSFDQSIAIDNPMRATHFGFPFFLIPERLEGYYKYKAGPVFTSKGNPVANKTDQCDIYGVLYETDENLQFLDGSNSLTSPNIVALARSESPLPETDQWTKFDFEFLPQNGKAIDKEKIKKGAYKLAIVFSSSLEGASFNGAVGSTLYIDEVKLTAKDPE